MAEPKQNPCYMCKDRTATCHGTCEKYLSWKKHWDASRKKQKNLTTFKSWYQGDYTIKK